MSSLAQHEHESQAREVIRVLTESFLPHFCFYDKVNECFGRFLTTWHRKKPLWLVTSCPCRTPARFKVTLHLNIMMRSLA